jgi:hypothetical protein
MTAAITTLRTTLATALTNASVWDTYAFPPPNVPANSVVIAPSDPYIVPTNNRYDTVAPMANFIINIFVPLLDNEGNLNGIEERVVAVFQKLSASSIAYKVGDVTAPAVLSAASGDLLTCTMQVSILTSWS